MPEARQFQLIAGHPALDFANTLDRYTASGPVELISSYGDFLQFGIQAGLLTSAEARRLAGRVKPGEAERTLQVARALREALERIFVAGAAGENPPSADLSLVNDAVAAAMRHRKLHRRAGAYAWQWEDMDSDAASPLWPIAFAAGELLVSDQAGRVRRCECETCQWLFLDTSKNRSRKWCDMQVCGNRMKARAYYRRQVRRRRGNLRPRRRPPSPAATSVLAGDRRP